MPLQTAAAAACGHRLTPAESLRYLVAASAEPGGRRRSSRRLAVMQCGSLEVVVGDAAVILLPLLEHAGAAESQSFEWWPSAQCTPLTGWLCRST